MCWAPEQLARCPVPEGIRCPSGQHDPLRPASGGWLSHIRHPRSLTASRTGVPQEGLVQFRFFGEAVPFLDSEWGFLPWAL